jgi:bifunctional DNase/RNase
LDEVDGDRKLPIVIGAFEAQSIAIAIEEEIRPSRPLTHDLFKNFADRFDIVVKQVIIHKLVDGVFFSSMICERDGIEEILDARTSDAIALAIRFFAPIFTYKDIMNKAGIILNTDTQEEREITDKVEDTQTEKIVQTSDWGEFSISTLNNMLDEAIDNEDYEKAAKIRDEISKREE